MADSDQKQEQKGGGTATSAPERETAAVSESPTSKARRNFLIGSVVLLLLLVAAFFYWRSTFTEDTDDAQVDGDLYQVSARVSGHVVDVRVTENEWVNKGDLIAQLDPRDYQVALEQALAELANARASYAQATSTVPITAVSTRTQVSTSNEDVATAQAGVAVARKQVAAAEARVDQQKANALKAQLDVDRYTPLVAKDIISKQQYDQAVAQAAATKAGLMEAQQDVIAQQENVREAEARFAASQSNARQALQNGPKQVQVEEARAQAANAQIQQAQARVDQAQLNLGYCRIVAPISGIISKKNVDVGVNVSTGQNLLTIVPLDNLWVTANFKETQLAHMKTGQAVTIKVDALGGRKYKGHITQIGGATGSKLSLFPPENATGNYVKVVQRIPVRIDLDKGENNDHLLRPGYSVEPDVDIK